MVAQSYCLSTKLEASSDNHKMQAEWSFFHTEQHITEDTKFLSKLGKPAK